MHYLLQFWSRLVSSRCEQCNCHVTLMYAYVTPCNAHVTDCDCRVTVLVAVRVCQPRRRSGGRHVWGDDDGPRAARTPRRAAGAAKEPYCLQKSPVVRKKRALLPTKEPYRHARAMLARRGGGGEQQTLNPKP